MPSVKNKRSKLSNEKQINRDSRENKSEMIQKRRPSDALTDTVDVVKVEASSKEENQVPSPNQSETIETHFDTHSTQDGAKTSDRDSFDFGNPTSERIHIRFPGDTIVKRGFPKAFQLTEEIVNGWAAGGQFDSLPIQNPFLRYAAKAGLKKAKEVETKVLESPVTEKVITKVFEAGLKAQNTIEEIRQKLNLRG
jgi:hypothetical protein